MNDMCMHLMILTVKVQAASYERQIQDLSDQVNTLRSVKKEIKTLKRYAAVGGMLAIFLVPTILNWLLPRKFSDVLQQFFKNFPALTGATTPVSERHVTSTSDCSYDLDAPNINYKEV